MMIGSGLEAGLGAPQLATVYFLSALGGNLFSCVLTPASKSVGASTAIFGMLGYYVAYLYTEWDSLADNRQRQFSVLMFTVLMILVNIQISMMNPQVDTIGHLGGLIVGVFMGFVISEN